MSEAIDWLQPMPLWRLDQQDYTGLFTPALLEFQTDDFMDEFFAAAQARRADALRAAVLGPPEQGVAKLYQPVHGRFYLVCCSLCCRVPGFPDRVVRLEDGERVFFVLRRLVNGIEYAWTGSDPDRRWEPVPGAGRTLLPGEERLSMAETTTSAGRSLFFGYVPVASGATFKQTAPADGALIDTRIEEFGARFTQPITGMLDQDGNLTPNTMSIGLTDDTLARTVSVYVLLEGWEWLLQELPDVAAVLASDAGAALLAPKLAEKQSLLDGLEAIELAPGLSLQQAFTTVAQQQVTLNQVGGVEGNTALDALGFDGRYNLKYSGAGSHPLQNDLLGLIELVRAALSDERPPLTLPKLAPRDDETYTLRCVYARPQCEEQAVVISRRSLIFRLAPFFDSDAPARPIRIPLPGDVSIAGMRKFKKNVSFMMSNAMRRKMNTVLGKEQDMLDGNQPNAEDSFDLAFICSFSIQIIFIIAFMLLLIFVFVFNIVFWWIAFFRICFPIPKSLAPK